jgi:hypothetical protein
MPVRKGVKTPPGLPAYDQIKAMAVDYRKVAELMDKSGRELQKIFSK